MKCRFCLNRIEHPIFPTIATMDAKPECGEDFCDLCSDCLACYGDDHCPSIVADGRHTWVIYVESLDEARAIAAEYGAKLSVAWDEGGHA